jgi:sugar phosphate isomerase/epimerase
MFDFQSSKLKAGFTNLVYVAIMYKNLDKSYKRRFPFRLATTSFIYPADWVTNVRRLGPYLDEIELLFLESSPDALPTPAEIAALADLGRSLDVTYNIHLPYDVSACDPDPGRRAEAVDRLKQVIYLSAALAPTTHTLHLPFDKDHSAGWPQRAEDSIARLAAAGVDPASLSIETLDYPLGLVADVVERHGLSVCIDVGHLIVHKMDVDAVLDRWLSRTAVVHLHGAAGGRDHLPLGQMPPQTMRPVLKSLRNFGGTVSLEVFSFDHLAASLKSLDAFWREVDISPRGIA